MVPTEEFPPGIPFTCQVTAGFEAFCTFTKNARLRLPLTALRPARDSRSPLALTRDWQQRCSIQCFRHRRLAALWRSAPATWPWRGFANAGRPCAPAEESVDRSESERSWNAQTSKARWQTGFVVNL